jgi:hypothetical protein
MRLALAPRTSSQGNLSHTTLEVAVGKQAFGQIVATCAAHDSSAKEDAASCAPPP